jgi:REP element-mobilizing transposase RayT
MSVRKQIPYSTGTFFITFTCINWIPLFEIANAYSYIYSWFDYLRNAGHSVHAYIIMPNHIHLIISFKGETTNINKIIGGGKRFLAYQIINNLKVTENNNLLIKLESYVTKSERSKNKCYSVFEPSFDWKCINTKTMFLQKLDYIHKNPTKGTKPLVVCPENYPHSSYASYNNLDNEMYIVDKYPIF